MKLFNVTVGLIMKFFDGITKFVGNLAIFVLVVVLLSNIVISCQKTSQPATVSKQTPIAIEKGDFVVYNDDTLLVTAANNQYITFKEQMAGMICKSMKAGDTTAVIRKGTPEWTLCAENFLTKFLK